MFAFLSTPVYIRLSPFMLSMRDVKNGVTIAEIPEIAVVRGPNARVLGAGAEAARHRSNKVAEIINPFMHPRSMVSDFVNGQRVLKAFFAKLKKQSRFSLAPRVVFHLQGNPSGGFTQVEIRAFQEMALGAGSSRVTLWHGPELTDEQVLLRHFPTSGQILE